MLEPIFLQFAALCPEQPGFDPGHPLGCHRRRIPNRVVFELLIASLVHGSGYERVATDQCSDRTIRRRLHLWAEAGLGEQLHELALDAYDRMIGLDLADVSADGAITKAPCGGDRAGRSPVDRGKGMKRSTGVDGYGIPLGQCPGTLMHRLRVSAVADHQCSRSYSKFSASNGALRPPTA
ncbi:hypothetical protein DLJ59_25070 [Micromonospora inaquosa]|uniref:Transposase n=2 Tax=Micromonospora TaxID=1873 RepID=A0A3N9WUD0_9ACTN|nr:hypothetical protein DLJ59_25070 [Micromonospora inaquosa]RQX04485.1 hypothetical protein DLJ58_27505 [Micromonospora arida]